MSIVDEELAIIADTGVGVRDTNWAMLWFTVHGLNGSALQCLSWDVAQALIETHGITNINSLNGQACVVSVGNGLMRFVRLHNYRDSAR